MARLQDRVVIVTGGAQGIGRAYCQGLAQEGAKVVVADIDEQRAASTARELQEHGAQTLAIAADVGQEHSATDMIGAALSRFGRIDGLVNNAAMYQRPAVRRGPFWELTVEEWDRVMGVNVRGIFLCSRAVAEPMREQRSGSIVNISSGTVHSGTPMFAHYVTSKAAVIGLTRVMARELGDYNIRVNAIAPGYTQSLDDPDDEFMTRLRHVANMRCLKRVQEPRDLVGTVIFFCSDDSAFITGQTLLVDGGSSMS
ncbi:MAG TPA: 3-oxoacyl-ACP reductase family protein [Chloroflexota bacterium]|nr:3-oxoacyl-ACP reductase family protein [Chloroflexota bacterium]